VDRFCARYPPSAFRGDARSRDGNALSGAVIWTVRNGIYYLASLPERLQGQIWRLVTFVFVPASSGWLTLLMLYFYYFIGSTMEREWGQAKFNLYFFSGMLFTVIYAFLVHFLGGGNLNPYYVAELIYLSMFFSFATYYPDVQVLLFFIIPIKIKWLAWVMRLLPGAYLYDPSQIPAAGGGGAELSAVLRGRAVLRPAAGQLCPAEKDR
jgi:hypothetical protein